MANKRLKEFRTAMESLESCCLRDAPFKSSDVAEVLVWRWRESTWEDAPKGGTDSSSYAVVKLADGRYGTVDESEDYTGHGCQCGSSATVHTTLEGAIRLGLTVETRPDARAQLKEKV